jgi:hypothetical protein
MNEGREFEQATDETRASRRARPDSDEPQRCPSCGSHSLAAIEYGLPAFSEELREDEELGRVVLGGCLVTDDDPTKRCLACGIVIWPDGRTMSEVEWRP